MKFVPRTALAVLLLVMAAPAAAVQVVELCTSVNGERKCEQHDPFGLWCVSSDARNASSAAAGAMVATGLATRGNLYAIGGVGIAGAAIGYYAGPEAAASFTGGIAAFAGARTPLAFGIGALAGGLTAGSGGEPFVGGVIGAVEAVLNSSQGSAARATTYAATLGPALRGGMVGAAAASTSKMVEASIDAANVRWGDCSCGKK